MVHQFTYSRMVNFAETDMAGILHFSNYTRYMEECEHALFRSLGRSIHEQDGDRLHGWPRVSMTMDYLAPLRFEQTVEIQLLIKEKRAKVIRYGFVFRRDEQIVARGKTTAVHTLMDLGSGAIKSAPMPDDLFNTLEPAPPELFTLGGFIDGEW